jgi:ATP phosphoribosyltransferase regulatory subunit
VTSAYRRQRYILPKLIAGVPPLPLTRAIRAPWSDDPALEQAMQALRREGQVVIQFGAQETARSDEFLIDRELVPGSQGWQVRALEQ